ncbi:phosphoribosylformylglycinamidine synthase I [Candidatus Neomarinimicrobiota bacterium]
MNANIKIAVIQFPGSNTERESVLALRRSGMTPHEFLWNADPGLLSDFDGFVIIGGFSYEDRSRAGIIAAMDPIMETIIAQANSGKPVLGICNGAQILLESGLIPGCKNRQIAMALTNNKRTKGGQVLSTGYYNRWTYLCSSIPSERTAFTRDLQNNQVLHIPFAHAEGRFTMSKELLNELIDNNQIVFRYCDNQRNVTPEFPINPNGSVYNIAGVCNPSGNVMALMPHPERTPNGDPIFVSMRDYIISGEKQPSSQMKYQPPIYKITEYKPDSSSHELIIELLITDNEVFSVNTALHHLELPASITRQTHWEIVLEDFALPSVIKQIHKSGELYNSNKERPIDRSKKKNTTSLLVQPKEDLLGRHKLETLHKRLDIDGIKQIKSGVLWNITVNRDNLNSVAEQVLKTNILFNPFSHDCYEKL